MAYFFRLKEEDLEKVERLFKDRIDNGFVVLRDSNGFIEIAQYSQKYGNVKLVTVPSTKLDWTKRLA